MPSVPGLKWTFAALLWVYLLVFPVATVVASDSLVSASSLMDDKEVARFLSSLEYGEEEGQSYGKRCGQNKLCRDGLECADINIGSLLPMRQKRCLPTKECLQNKLSALQLDNVEAYKALVFERAGISETEFLELQRGSETRQSFQASAPYRALMESLRVDGLSQAIWDIQRECAIIDDKQINSTTSTNAPYIGLHFEGGFVLDGTFNFLEGRGVDGVREFVRGCLGVEIGLGAEVGFVYGTVVGGDLDDLQCVSFFADLDLGLGVAVGVAFGIGVNGRPLLEYTIGGGLGAGAGGSICGGLKYNA